MPDQVILRYRDEVAQVILNRPERGNALDASMLEELCAVLRSVVARQEVHVIVLHGTGLGFCAGADLNLLGKMDQATDPVTAFMPAVESLQHAVSTIATAPKVTIAAVHGFVLGAGLDLVLACDLRLAAAGTQFAANQVHYGLVPDGGATWALPRLIGLGPSLNMLLSGDPVEAEGAYRLGLIHRRVGRDRHVVEAVHWAEDLSRHSLASQIAIKRLARVDPRLTLSAALKEEKESQRRLVAAGEPFNYLKSETEAEN